MSIYDISCTDINFQAKKGCFFSDEKGNTSEMGRFEWVLRSIFCFLPLIDSPEKVCLQRSWKFLEDLPQVPKGIAFQIENYFNESRSSWNKLHHVALSIAKVYATKLRQDAIVYDTEENNLDLSQEAKQRKYSIIDGKGYLFGKVTNPAPYKIDFYKLDRSKSWTLTYKNSLFLVDDSADNRLGEINFDYRKKLFGPNKVVKMEFTDRDHKCLFQANLEPDDRTFIFREKGSFIWEGKKLAIAIWDGPQSPQKWSLTFINPQEPVDRKVRDYMALALAKLAENYCSDQDIVT